MKELIEKGIKSGLISLKNDEKTIVYIHQNKKFRFAAPEELVRATTYVSLVEDYGYNPKQIDIEYAVPYRTPNIFADIVVFEDKTLKTPLIVVECKREEATEGELQQAIEQGFGYANSLKAHYFWLTSGLRNDYFNISDYPAMERVKNRLADLPKAGQKQIARAKYVKGGKGGFELNKVSEAELTRVFKQAHDALWGGGKRNPSEAFDELDKLIFCKIWDEKADRIDGVPYDFQVFSDDEENSLRKRIQALYERGREKDPEVFREDVRLSNAELRTVVSYLAGLNLEETDLDSKGRAFETFMTGFFRGEFGQYFTPRNIVQFIVDSLPIANDKLVLDTSCGSGGFLLFALNKIRREADKRVEEGYYKLNTLKGKEQHKKYWHDFAKNNLFGIEISEGIARTAKMNMIIHDDGHTNVISFDGLDSIDRIREKSQNKGFKHNRFDFIITNPPFGSKIKSSEKRYMEDYVLGCKELDWIDARLKNINLNMKNIRDQQTSEVLFLEQCHNFLKPGGYLAMVVPDSILTNSTTQYVREWIEDHWRIISVVSMPQFAFTATGAGVKSSVIFLKKYDDSTIASIRNIKDKARDMTFERDAFGPALEKLIKEKEQTLKNGDIVIKQIEEELVGILDALKIQGTLTSDEKKELYKQAIIKIKKHMKTDEYNEWKNEITEDFNDRINTLKENLQDEYSETIKKELSDYQIFMAIADDIGYDATGRETKNNELKSVSLELFKFIEHLESGDPHPFVYPPASMKI